MFIFTQFCYILNNETRTGFDPCGVVIGESVYQIISYLMFYAMSFDLQIP
jgi:hypothetical protein